MKALLLTMGFGSILCTGMAQNVNALVTDVREERQLDQKNSSLELSLKINGLVHDPDEKIVAINVYNGQGEKMNNGWFSSGNQQTINLSAPPENSWRVEVIMENVAAVKAYTFRIGQVFLP